MPKRKGIYAIQTFLFTSSRMQWIGSIACAMSVATLLLAVPVQSAEQPAMEGERLKSPSDQSSKQHTATPPKSPTTARGTIANGKPGAKPLEPLDELLPDSHQTTSKPDRTPQERAAGLISGTMKLSQDLPLESSEPLSEPSEPLDVIPLEESPESRDTLEPIETPVNEPDPVPAESAESAESESSQDAPDPTAPPAEEPAPVSSAAESGDRWQFSAAPYFFVPFDVRADVTVLGRSASLRAGLNDILDLDEAFDIGLRLEARNRRFGILLDGFYLSAGQSGTLPVTFPAGSLQSFGIPVELQADADASVSLKQGNIDLAAFYRVIDRSFSDSATDSNPYPRLALDPILGVRTNIFRQEVEVEQLQVGSTTIPINREFSYSRTTLEPLLGLRLELELSKRWSIGFRGDVSGFNINAERDITWNLLAGARYYVSSSTALQLAYGFSGFDFKNGDGLRRVEVDQEQHGLWLSALFRF